jgi:hypothetical protein
MAYDYQFGETEGGMQLLKDLNIRAAPQSGYRPYSVVVRLGNGLQQGNGFPIVTWHWAFVSIAERDVFADVLDGALSAAAYIRTRLPDGTWATFSCIMNAPTGEENLSNGTIINFDLTFTHCVLIPDV